MHSSSVRLRCGVLHLNGSSEELDASLSDFLIAAGDVCCHRKALDKHTWSCTSDWVVSDMCVSIWPRQYLEHLRLGKLADHSECMA